MDVTAAVTRVRAVEYHHGKPFSTTRRRGTRKTHSQSSIITPDNHEQKKVLIQKSFMVERLVVVYCLCFFLTFF